MRDYEQRRQAVGEMHLRRWPRLRVPSQVIQWVLKVEDSEREEELGIIEAATQSAADADNPSHRSGQLSENIHVTWEKHSEGTSLTIFCAAQDVAAFLDPNSSEEMQAALDWAQQVPGKIVRCTRIWVAEDDAAVEALLSKLDLNRHELVSTHIGKAISDPIRIWSDFRIKEDGFGRLLVAANGAEPGELTRQVQRLQELGNYRNRALLGFPVAQACWPKLDDAERRLRELSTRITNGEESDDALMEALSGLSLELTAIASEISFRMDATKAYAQLVHERLEQVDPRPIDGFASLTDFTQRRFRPAMSTCEATTERVRQLALRASQLASLLRARIETRIENQNARLLLSMEKSTSMQVRLQQLVEGFSVVALSYYLIGLVGYFLPLLPLEQWGLSKNAVLAGLVIPVVATIWISMRLLRRRLFSD
ncbi:DUF3422 domain-containing protein [Altererythrobacter lutimaris]|uniref:DUF3422 domain-containing protein n=1 Tax=Altererythrobacter lutimaris TaxID=2743979 RepID=A0A850HAH7_9SPHN|nr:DUF3422 domain-containing protein [Altererythrobacter lutimaris]NVE94993.1 DUF3422 domain-containing protein [Altererythrobacter lutimaris]